jgi:CheY-like chemotaxis protein
MGFPIFGPKSSCKLPDNTILSEVGEVCVSNAKYNNEIYVRFKLNTTVKILHVDDNFDDNFILSSQLKRINNDLDITWVDSASEALKALKENEFDCIISDYQMPEMDGLVLLQAIREEDSHIPFIFLTGQGNESIAAETLRSGASDYFPKEINNLSYQRLVNAIKVQVEANSHILEQERINDGVDYLIKETSFVFGQNYFDILAQCLSELSDASYALIGKLSEDMNSITTISAFVKGSIVDNFSYELPGTPCAVVVGKSPCTYLSGVQKLFPEDHLLVEMGVEGYIGIPLFDGAGKANGIAVVMDEKPLPETSLLRSMIISVATRASYEIERLERIKTGKNLNTYYSTLEELVDLSHWQYQAQSGNLTITGQVLKLLGFKEAQKELPIEDFLSHCLAADRPLIKSSIEQCAEKPGEKVRFKFHINCADGKIRHLRSVAVATSDSANVESVTNYFGIMEDITDELAE